MTTHADTQIVLDAYNEVETYYGELVANYAERLQNYGPTSDHSDNVRRLAKTFQTRQALKTIYREFATIDKLMDGNHYTKGEALSQKMAALQDAIKQVELTMNSAIVTMDTLQAYGANQTLETLKRLYEKLFA